MSQSWMLTIPALGNTHTLCVCVYIDIHISETSPLKEKKSTEKVESNQTWLNCVNTLKGREVV